MESINPEFFVIFLLLGCSLKAEAKPTNAQILATIREAEPLKISHGKVTKTYIIYQKKNIGLSWKDARASCKEQNGDLATLKNYKDFDLIASILKDKPDYDGHLWLGGYLNGAGPNWKANYVWISGEPIPVNFGYWKYKQAYFDYEKDPGDNDDKEYEPLVKERGCLILAFKSVRRNGEKNKNALATETCNYSDWKIDGYVCEF